jgi:hypothetical protein
LAAHAASPPAGLTDADPDSGERWDAGQAWAHLAEFVPYWMGQLGRVLEPGAIEPVSFGRVKTDPDRIAAIEQGRAEPPARQMERLSAALDEVRAFLSRASQQDLARRGTHPTRGEMDVATLLERFILGHLEEHADQLDRLAASG